jgi:hypothetical protein
MSTLVVDTEVFNYIHSGLLRMAKKYGTITEFHAYAVVEHFDRKGDHEKEATRLIKTWMYLNDISYEKRYKEQVEKVKFTPTFVHRPMSAIQLLKYMECLEYNIDEEPEAFKFEIALLRSFIADLTKAIIHHSTEYNEAKWCD